jgi:hypothetical protein
MLEWLVCGVSFHKEDTLAQCSPQNSFFISEFFFMQSETDDIMWHSALEAVESLIPQEVCFASASCLPWASGLVISVASYQPQEEQSFYSTLQITGNYN